MERKKFIQISGLSLGLAMIPGLAKTENPGAKKLSKSPKPKIITEKEGEVYNVIGDVQTHKLMGSETGGQIVEWVNNVMPGVGIPPHFHTREDEIFRVIKGQVEVMVDGKTTVLKEGDIAFAPKNLPHSWKVVGTENARMITSAFPAGIEEMFYELADLPDGPPDFDKVAEICGKHGVKFV